MSDLCQPLMKPAIENRRHQRQDLPLPLRLTAGDAEGRLLFKGETCNIGAGGLHFRTPNWGDFQVGTSVYVVIDMPSDMFHLLPFGGMRASGEVVRIEASRDVPVGATPRMKGVAVKLTSRLCFDPELNLPRFDHSIR